jgi:hypothetical protein
LASSNGAMIARTAANQQQTTTTTNFRDVILLKKIKYLSQSSFIWVVWIS